MERKILMIRHAKSSWSNPLQSDFERPLNERGEKDAPMMAERLKALGLLPDLIISSPAKRARQTARRIAGTLGISKEEIRYYDNLYHCIPSVFEEILREVPDTARTIYLVAHNPGITDFVNEMSDKFKVDNVPTCGVAGIRFDAEQWSDFGMESHDVFLFEYPKKPYDTK